MKNWLFIFTIVLIFVYILGSFAQWGFVWLTPWSWGAEGRVVFLVVIGILGLISLVITNSNKKEITKLRERKEKLWGSRWATLKSKLKDIKLKEE